MTQLPKFQAALAELEASYAIPAQAWKVIDAKLSQQLLQAASSAIRPLGTTRYESVSARRHLP